MPSKIKQTQLNTDLIDYAYHGDRYLDGTFHQSISKLFIKVSMYYNSHFTHGETDEHIG